MPPFAKRYRGNFRGGSFIVNYKKVTYRAVKCAAANSLCFGTERIPTFGCKNFGHIDKVASFVLQKNFVARLLNSIKFNRSA